MYLRTGAIVIALLLAGPSFAQADQTKTNKDSSSKIDLTRRTPAAAKGVRNSEVTFEQYHQVFKVVRKRSGDKEFAVFSAEPHLLDGASVILLQAQSVAPKGNVTRWRCVAYKDIADCLGVPLKIRYLPADTEVVLSAVVIPKIELAQTLKKLARR